MGNTRSGWQNHTSSGDLLTIVQCSGHPFRNVPRLRVAGQLEKVDGDRTTLTPLFAPVRAPGFGEKLGYEYINSVSLAKLGVFLDPIGPLRPVTLRGHGHAR